MSLYEEDKKLYRFLKHIEFIRGYFKDGEWIDVVNPEHLHLEGISRQEAKFLYEKECKKKKKYDSVLGRIKSTVTQKLFWLCPLRGRRNEERKENGTRVKKN